MAFLQPQSRSAASSSSNAEFISSNSPRKPCIFTSLFHSFDLQAIEQTSVTNALLVEARTVFGVNFIPVTVCATHGNAGFLPLDYVRMLPQYTRMANAFKVVHLYEDCILMFRPDQGVGVYGDTRQVYQFGDDDDHRSFSKCYRCNKSLLNRFTFMFRDNPYCSHHCRYAAHVAHCLKDKVVKDMENAQDIHAVSKMKGKGILNIVAS